MLLEIAVAFYMCLGCNQPETTIIKDTSLLYQHWIHSFEEDDAKKEQLVYRPATYPFPLARGREGFEIMEKGILISHPIGSGDVNMSIEEKWTLIKDKLTIISKERNLVYMIVSVSKEKLVLRPLLE
jgi:hypothetical protein